MRIGGVLLVLLAAAPGRARAHAGEVRVIVQAFMAELNLSFPALLDPDMAVLHAYQVPGLPASVLIDRHGVIRVVEIGYRDWDSAGSRKRLETLLDGPPSRAHPGGGGDT